MLRTTAVLLLFLGGCIPRGYCEDDLTQEARLFLANHSSAAIEAKWRKAWDSRVATAAQVDSFPGEEALADATLFDFLADSRSKFSVKTEGDKDVIEKRAELDMREKLEICRWYLLYKDKGWGFSERVAAQLTQANYNRWIAMK